MNSYSILTAATALVVATAVFMTAVYWLRSSQKNRQRREFEQFHRFEGNWAKK